MPARAPIFLIGINLPSIPGAPPSIFGVLTNNCVVLNSLSTTRADIVYDDAVTRADLETWGSDLEHLFTLMEPLFCRAESRGHAQQYMRGLISPLQRKNGWTIAEYVGEPEPKALQRFLNLSPWNADALLDLNREYAMQDFADPGAILVADPTGFAKKGTRSVGVQRQYSGTLGRIDNCQIATFLAYVTGDRDRVLLDRRLYMPESSWMADQGRRADAGVPEDLVFRTRPQQVQEMIAAARAAGVPFAWFTADEEFGQNRALCGYLEQNRIPYVMAVPKTTHFTGADGHAVQFDEIAARVPRNSWQRRACGIGSKGYRVYDWALVDSDATDHKYMIRRSIDDGELAYYHCYNPDHTGFAELVHVAGARWPIEECFGAAKNEVGLDNYQVRTWNAWHRHITLAMLAHTFLAVTAHKAKKRGAKTPNRRTDQTIHATNPPNRKSSHPSTNG
jgi:SRSO17 transposase